MGAALLVVLALASVGVTLHEHVTDAQYADCDACHFRHLPGVATVQPALSAPGLVVRAVVSARPEGERSVALGACPTRRPARVASSSHAVATSLSSTTKLGAAWAHVPVHASGVRQPAPQVSLDTMSRRLRMARTSPALWAVGTA